jgi:hypothetical protein
MLSAEVMKKSEVASACQALAVLGRHSQTAAEAKQSARRDFERRDSEGPKPTSERQRSAEARFRPKKSLWLVAEPMLYRRSASPSRRRIVSPPVETSVFHGAKRSPS